MVVSKSDTRESGSECWAGSKGNCPTKAQCTGCVLMEHRWLLGLEGELTWGLKWNHSVGSWALQLAWEFGFYLRCGGSHWSLFCKICVTFTILTIFKCKDQWH